MARHKLTPRQILNAVDGDFGDGDGLWLRIRDRRGSWVFRFTSPAGSRREMGLGALVRNNVTEAGKSLTQARDLAEDARKLIRDALDPLAERDRRNDEARRAFQLTKFAKKAELQTVARVARAYHERVIEPTRCTKHAADWIKSLEMHVPERIWHVPIDTVKAPDLLDFFIDIHKTHRETSRRIVQRLSKVFADAVFRELVSANVAAAAAERLHEMKIAHEVRHFAALPYAEVSAFMRGLREQEGVAARALEFTVLTASRTNETLGASWDEFDFENSLWTIPGMRMKKGEVHAVHLSERALEIVTAMQELGQPYVFPSPLLDGAPLSNTSMLMLLRRMDADKRTTVHGLARASFSTWANETGTARPDVIEACLAHRESNIVRAAYNRAQFTAERKALLSSWADFCGGKDVAGNVLPFQRAA